MQLTNRERALVLRGVFEVTITYAEDDDLRERCADWPSCSAAILQRCVRRSTTPLEVTRQVPPNRADRQIRSVDVVTRTDPGEEGRLFSGVCLARRCPGAGRGRRLRR